MKRQSLSFFIETRILLIVVVLVLGALALSFIGSENLKIVDITTDEKTVRVYVEIADSPDEVQKGLMFRESLDEMAGMLFIFENEQPRTFWMKNTLIPLDIIFIAQNLTIVDIRHDFSPCKADPCPVYASAGPATYVLEVNGGYAERNKIEPGDTIVLDA